MKFVILLLLSLIARAPAPHIPEDELVRRRMVLDRKKPYRKLNKYLSCQVCQMASQSMHKVMLISMADKAHRHLAENDLYSLVTETCNPWSNIGVWITAMDFWLNEENGIEIENRQNMGQCKRECETIRSVCEDVIYEDNDAEQIAQFLFERQREATEEILLEYMCSDICLRDGIRPEVPKKLQKKYKIGQEIWEEMSYEEQAKRVDIFQEMTRQNAAQKTGL